MTTLGERVAQRDGELFVGRREELDRIDAILAKGKGHIVHVSGVGGVGKSTLLREVQRRAEARGLEVLWLDGRELPPFPAVLDDALTAIDDGSRSVVIIDSYEVIGSLDAHLRDVVIPNLPDTTIVVLAGRHRPSAGWFQGGWDAVVDAFALDGLSPDETRQLATMHGLGIPQADAIGGAFRGSPLAIVVAAHTGSGGSSAELAERLLGDEVESDHYRTLSVAAIARVTTPELLEAVHPGTDGQEAFKWLADRSFSEPLADGIALHPLVADAVQQALCTRDPAGEAALRRRIADHVYERAVAGQFALSSDLQHLVQDPQVKWGFSADVGNRYRIDIVREGDTDEIGAILHAVGLDDWWASTRVFFDEHSEYVGVARGRDGAVGGYYVAVSPGSAPAAAEVDPLLGPWLRYARETLHSNSVVLWREAVDLTGENGEVTALLGAAGVLGSGVINPRYGMLPIDPRIPAAEAFSAALGGEHHPDLDLLAFGMHLACHVVDFGPRGLLGFQRDWIYRETGARPPTEHSRADAARLIRLLREPNGLAIGYDWLGATPSKRRDALRGIVGDALEVFGSHRDDQLARAIIEAAYLEDGASHETIARRFHLSRSAYFRRLQAATSRLADELASRGVIPR